MTLTIKRKRIPVTSFADASARVNQHNVGKSSSRWYRRPAFDANGNGAIVRDGIVIAHVSFNGRVWEGPETMRAGAVEITEVA